MKHNARPRHFSAAQTHNGREAGSMASDELYARVAALAYSFYEQRGCEHGHDVEDWVEAEQTIRADATQNRDNAI